MTNKSNEGNLNKTVFKLCTLSAKKCRNTVDFKEYYTELLLNYSLSLLENIYKLFW